MREMVEQFVIYTC